jgi:hypothetical protein
MATLMRLREMPLSHVKGELAEFKFSMVERADPEVENLHRSRKEFQEAPRLLPIIGGVGVVEEQVATEESVIQTIPEDGHFPYSKVDDLVMSAVTKEAAPEVDKRKVEFGAAIRVTGNHEATVRLHGDVVATVTLQVVAAK